MKIFLILKIVFKWNVPGLWGEIYCNAILLIMRNQKLKAISPSDFLKGELMH